MAEVAAEPVVAMVALHVPTSLCLLHQLFIYNPFPQLPKMILLVNRPLPGDRETGILCGYSFSTVPRRCPPWGTPRDRLPTR